LIKKLVYRQLSPTSDLACDRRPSQGRLVVEMAVDSVDRRR